MKNKKIIALALFAVTAGTSLFAGDQTAWERKTVEKAKREAQKEDASTFVSSLSPFHYKQFQSFTPEQKKLAMDYADGNKMTPDEAVSKVGGR